MKTLRALLGNPRGFTLVEMLVATAIMGFVLSAALLAVQAGTQASDVTAGRAEAQSSIRFALDRMLADMRAAGYDPSRHLAERQIKALTRHQYRFEQDGGVRAELVFDL